MNELTSAQVYAVGFPIVALMIAAEAAYSAISKRHLYKKYDSFGTLGLLAGNILMVGLVGGLALAVNLWAYQYRLIDLNTLLPEWAVWVLAFFLIDFCFYCFHRVSHRVRFFWAIHLSHHCSVEMNFLVAFRQAWFAPLVKIPFFATLPLLFGLDPTILVVAGTMSQLWGVVGHTQWVGKLWWPIEWVFNTPSAHRVHHGSNPQYLDKNYGNLFMIWDRLLGTYQAEEEPVQFGLVRNVDSNNPITITLYGWRQMAADLRASRTWRDAFASVFAPPDWEQRSSGNSDSL